MSTTPNFSAILLTAPPPGQAAEAGGPFVKVDGRETLLRTVELFFNKENIHQVAVVFEADFIESAREKYGGHFGFSGVRIVKGGSTWIEQIIAASEKLSETATHVIIHDAARPAVPYTDLECLMEAAMKHDAIVMTTPIRTGLIELDEGGFPIATHGVERFTSMITPLVFNRSVYEEICRTKAMPHASKLHLEKGSPLNMRVGGPGDASIAKAMLGLLPKPKLKASSPFEEAQW